MGAPSRVDHNIGIVFIYPEGAFFKYYSIAFSILPSIAGGLAWNYVPGVDWVLFSGLPRATMEEAASQRLQQAFRQISDGNFSHRIEAMPTNTLSTLVNEFNNMSARLDLAEKHRQEMERQLRQSQKMEAVGRLAGGVAHDYNNMLSVIMGYSEMALEKLTSHNALYSYLQKIVEAAGRSKELTRQLLAFARRQTIAPQVLNINDAIQSILSMLHPLIGEDVELAWFPGKQIWPITIDPSQIDQILANLCVNARDAINGVGKIIIKTTNIELDDNYCSLHHGFVPGKFVQLTLSDNGAGMDSAVLDNLFEPFFSTKTNGNGTGLGLATVYGIIKQNNGFITVDSELGRGTTFELFFPIATDQPGETSVMDTAILPVGNNEIVLLVEDEVAILNLSKRMLKQIGYRVVATNSPMEAIGIAENHSEDIDLLLTDVVMPELNGRDLAHRLQTVYPALKVLFMSGYPSTVIASRGVLDQDVFLLQKPFSKKELATKIAAVLHSKTHHV